MVQEHISDVDPRIRPHFKDGHADDVRGTAECSCVDSETSILSVEGGEGMRMSLVALHRLQESLEQAMADIGATLYRGYRDATGQSCDCTREVRQQSHLNTTQRPFKMRWGCPQQSAPPASGELF